MFPSRSGTISQWGEVSKPKKDRTRPKPKENTFTTTTGDSAPARNARGGRGGVEGGRGRGRATERGGRAARGKSAHATTNGARPEKPLSVPTDESSAWDAHKASDETGAWGSSDATAAAPSESATKNTSTTAAPAAAKSNADTAPAAPAQKTWASMLRQSTVPKAAPKPKPAPAPKPEETIEPLPPVAEPEAPEPEAPAEDVAEPKKEAAPAQEIPTVVVPEVALPPSKDQLTETNLEQIVDSSHPPDTETARSEAADSWDPRLAAASATATPLSASQQQHQNARAAASGYAATALKATERTATRTPSHSRRVLDQEEAVRMPGNRDVDRTTVQFGALSFSGADEDIDGDREDPETRGQPPVESPVSHPRASLPPVPQPASVPEAFPTQKPVTSLPTPQGPTGTLPPETPISQPVVADVSVAAPVAAPQQPAVASQGKITLLSILCPYR